MDIAREAGELARRRRTEGVAIAATKSAIADIVTDADREVEALIRARLAIERPGDGFLGEESGAARSQTDITWVVDPIDGTVNYAYGIPAYAVSIAAVRGDPRARPVGGARGCRLQSGHGRAVPRGAGSRRVASRRPARSQRRAVTGRRARGHRLRVRPGDPRRRPRPRRQGDADGERSASHRRGIPRLRLCRLRAVRRLLRAGPAAVGSRRRRALGRRGGRPHVEGRTGRHARSSSVRVSRARTLRQVVRGGRRLMKVLRLKSSARRGLSYMAFSGAPR